mgnify:CR=1 FL=1
MFFSSQELKLKSYLTDRWFRINLFFGLIANIFIWLFLAWQVGDLPDHLFLHYNIYFGVDLVGYWYRLFFLPLAGLLIMLVNFIIAAFFYKKERLLVYFLIFSSSFIQIIIFLAALAIVSINLN